MTIREITRHMIGKEALSRSQDRFMEKLIATTGIVTYMDVHAWRKTRKVEEEVVFLLKVLLEEEWLEVLQDQLLLDHKWVKLPQLVEVVEEVSNHRDKDLGEIPHRNQNLL